MTTTTPESAAPARGAALYRLLAWASPAFPTGGFSYSHGLEAAVASGAIRDRASLQDWVAAIVIRGSGRMDADILRDAYRAAQVGDMAALAEAHQRGIAYRATAELALESAQQGEAFAATVRAAWAVTVPEPAPHPGPLPASGERERAETPLHAGGEREGPARQAREGEGQAAPGPASHPAAFGVAAADAGIPLGDALVGYLQGFAGNLVSAGIRLGVLGQTDGQRILAALERAIVAAAAAALTRDRADFGGATFAADLASMAHETLYTRLFRS